MIRLLFVALVLLLLVGYYAWQGCKHLSRAQWWALLRPWLMVGGVGVLALLVLSGRLNGLLAVLGVGLAYAARSVPVLLQLMPGLLRLWLQLTRHAPASDGAAQSKPPPTGMPMTVAEALAVLGLQPGASRADVIAAHRRLMAKVHPDKGGSDFLAAQINRAKALLLQAIVD